MSDSEELNPGERSGDPRMAGGFRLAPASWLHGLWRKGGRYVRELRHLDELARGMDGRGLTKKHQIRALRFAAYGYALPIAFHCRDYCRFSDFLHRPDRAELAAAELANPQILFKMFHPYRRAGLSVAQRSELLIGHYDLATVLFGADLFRASHVERDGFLLCEVNLPNDRGVLPVRLKTYFRSWREGELSIGLYDPFGTRVYALTFSFQRDGASAGMFIGSLIGSKDRGNAKHLTKLMQGQRPQGLMLFLAQALCRYYGIESLQAVGRRAHVFAGSRREERLGFDYDSFWEEQGGTPLADDPTIYRLPVQPERRPEAEIASQKRAQYRRRYALLDEVEAALRSRLDAISARARADMEHHDSSAALAVV